MLVFEKSNIPQPSPDGSGIPKIDESLLQEYSEQLVES